jgi:hypothetical protein
MANTLGTTNADVIAQEALKALQARLPILGQIASDHSDKGAKYGERVVVHEVSAATAIDFNTANGYAPSDRTQVDIPVTINKHKHHTYGIGVQEASASRVDLIQRFALNAAYSLGSAIVQDLFALILNATFANKTTKALGAGGDGFDRKALLSVGAALSKRGVEPFGRFCVLNADYHASLMNDTALLEMLVLSGQKVVGGLELPQVHNFGVSEFVDLPANGENLVGIAGSRTSLAIATRIPDDPGEGFSNVSIRTVTEPQTGISVQVREWYDANLGMFKRTYTLMYGVAAGQTGALQRIVSA